MLWHRRQAYSAVVTEHRLCLLANCFLEGKGVPKNTETAIDLFERAERAGYRFAETALWLVRSEAVKV